MALELNVEKVKRLIYKKGINIPDFYKQQGWSRFKWHYMLKRTSTKNINAIAEALGVDEKTIIR